jgi:hypothetical protein
LTSFARAEMTEKWRKWYPPLFKARKQEIQSSPFGRVPSSQQIKYLKLGKSRNGKEMEKIVSPFFQTKEARNSVMQEWQ